VLPLRRAARDRVCLSDQVQPALLPQEPRLPQVKLLAKYQLPPDRVPVVESAAEYFCDFQF